MLTPIKNDLFDIAKRLENINSEYKLYRNNRDNRFEVHNSETPSGRTLCFVVPFSELDERTLVHAWRTAKCNFDALSAEFETHNRQINESVQNGLKEQQVHLADMLDFAAQKEHEVVFTKGNKWF